MDRLQKASFFFSIFSTIENKNTKCEESGSVGAPRKIRIQTGGGAEISTPALQNFQGFSDFFFASVNSTAKYPDVLRVLPVVFLFGFDSC